MCQERSGLWFIVVNANKELERWRHVQPEAVARTRKCSVPSVPLHPVIRSPGKGPGGFISGRVGVISQSSRYHHGLNSLSKPNIQWKTCLRRLEVEIQVICDWIYETFLNFFLTPLFPNFNAGAESVHRRQVRRRRQRCGRPAWEWGVEEHAAVHRSLAVRPSSGKRTEKRCMIKTTSWSWRFGFSFGPSELVPVVPYLSKT